MIMLAIETATPSCSVALMINDQLTSCAEIGNNIHSQVLLSMVDSLLSKAGIEVDLLNAVAVGQGPGSFTGLRIGVGVAQGIAYGANCPMVGISSLDALAHQAPSDGPVVAGIDARMGEIYWCEYVKKNNTVDRVTEVSVTSPADISVQQTAPQWLGNAWGVYKGQFSDALNVVCPDDSFYYPNAASLMDLARAAYQHGQVIAPMDFAPDYVRNEVAKKSMAGN